MTEPVSLPRAPNGSDRLGEAIHAARVDGRRFLTESEALEFARQMGITVPEHRFVRDSLAAEACDFGDLLDDRVVVKCVSPVIPHKAAVGGVQFPEPGLRGIVQAMRRIELRLANREIHGFLVSRFIEHDPAGELLLGMRWTREFGPVVTLGPGGTRAEMLASDLPSGKGPAIFSPALLGRVNVRRTIQGRSFGPALKYAEMIEDLIGKLGFLAMNTMPEVVAAFEINPLVLTKKGPVALDALLELAYGHEEVDPPRPTWKLKQLLEPSRVAIVGVSDQLNPGHVIVNNMLEAGFPRERLTIVKPGRDAIEGCSCVPDLRSLPEPVDLCVLAVSARRVPELVREVVHLCCAGSLIVVPGGLGESKGSAGLASEIRDTVQASRAGPGQGPVLNGPNCLGVRSLPGCYDSLFVPRRRLGAPDTFAPLALLSQSGAFVVSRLTRLPWVNPRYVVSIGNQLDLTLGDYMRYFADDPGVEIVACYTEGFRPLDGRHFLEAAAEITAAGRMVILYRAGRTPEGALAGASHTASVAGDYVVTRELAQQAGVVVVETLADFDDMLALSVGLRGRRAAGTNLGAMSNAGFECVAMADAPGPFHLPELSPHTVERLTELLSRHHLHGIVNAANPLDVTPQMQDEGFVTAFRAVLEDPDVDVGIVGCVPHTPALASLPNETTGRFAEGSVAALLAELHRDSEKPWVAVIDAGPSFAPLVQQLHRAGLPVFHTADRALRLLGLYIEQQLKRPGLTGKEAPCLSSS